MSQMMPRGLAPTTSRTNIARRQFHPFDMLQREIERLFDDFGRLPTTGTPRLLPDIEIAETDQDIEITAELPGLDRGDVDVRIDGNQLTIRAEKKAEQQRDDKNVHLTERSYGVFYRVLELPGPVDPAGVQATMANGVLKIRIPKPARGQSNRIEVREGPQGDGQSRQSTQSTQAAQPGQAGQSGQATGTEQNKQSEQKAGKSGKEAA